MRYTLFNFSYPKDNAGMMACAAGHPVICPPDLDSSSKSPLHLFVRERRIDRLGL